MTNLKSRDIPLTTLYFNLQVEYISYFVRGKVYCKNFSENYQNIALQKKEKIDKISEKNSLPSIFNDDRTKQDFVSYFLGEKGVPKFCYKDEEVERKMGVWDRHYFFLKGVSIKYLSSGNWHVGVVVKNNKYDRTLIVKDQFGGESEIHCNLAARIFQDNFWDF